MSGKEASEQRASLSGSGGLSHVYFQHPPLRCSIPETQGLYYDDANKLILSPTSDQVLSWKIGSLVQFDPPCSDSIGEGPILFIRYSLDKKVIAIQRSNHEVQFRNRETGGTFTQRCKPESESILGFFWTDCPTCDIVLVKTSGVDLFSYEPQSNNLHLVEAKRLNVSWYVYTHESRMVLLASGMQCKIFSGFQFSSVGIVRLPKFEMKMAKSEANHRPILSSEDVNIVTIYGRIYCLQSDKIDMQLHIYRFYRDAVVHQGSFPVYSSRIAVSVVDNVLLVHQVDAKVVILYDIYLDSLSPVSAPLPLLVRGTARGPSSSSSSSSSSQASARQMMDLESNTLSAYEGSMFGDSWRFLVPDMVCDVDHGLIWKIFLDLEAISASSSEVHSVLEFLQRRRSEPAKVKQLCLAMMRTIILERRPVSVVSKAINILVTFYSQDIKTQNASQRGGSRSSSDNPVSGACDSSSGSNGVTQGKLTRETGNQVEQFIPTVGKIEPAESSLVSTSNRVPSCSDSDSEETKNLEPKKTNSEDFLVKCMPGESRTLPDLKTSPVTSVAISPDEIFYFVFSLVEEAMGGDPSYLIAVIIEFLRSVSFEKLKVNQKLYTMIIKLLASSDRYAELGMFITNKILEPSKEVGFQLIETDHRQTRKLGMDMLRQQLLHGEYVQVLTKHGYYLEALRYARKNKVIISQPSIYLEAALSENNLEHLAALLRFFSDYIPGFENTSDHNRYHHIISVK